MADTTEAEEQREQQQPHLRANIAAIAELLAHDGELHQGEATAQRAAAANAKVYTRIEKDFHGNKDAAKVVRRLVKMGTSASDDFLRTFEGLCDHMGLWPAKDLVDEAEQHGGTVVLSDGDRGRPIGIVSSPDDDDGGDGESGDDDQGDEGEAAAGTEAAGDSNVTPFRSALDKGRAHLGTAEPAPPPPPKRGRKQLSVKHPTVQ